MLQGFDGTQVEGGSHHDLNDGGEQGIEVDEERDPIPSIVFCDLRGCNLGHHPDEEEDRQKEQAAHQDLTTVPCYRFLNNFSYV